MSIGVVSVYKADVYPSSLLFKRFEGIGFFSEYGRSVVHTADVDGFLRRPFALLARNLIYCSHLEDPSGVARQVERRVDRGIDPDAIA